MMLARMEEKASTFAGLTSHTSSTTSSQSIRDKKILEVVESLQNVAAKDNANSEETINNFSAGISKIRSDYLQGNIVA